MRSFFFLSKIGSPIKNISFLIDIITVSVRVYGTDYQVFLSFTGHGFQILIDLIRLFSVTHVVQLSFGNAPQCQLLTPDFLRTAHGWQTHPPTPPTLTKEPASHPSIRSHVFLSVQSEFEGAGTSGEM